MLRRILDYPENLFLLIAWPVGLVLCFLIPPLGGGKEVFDFDRAIAVTYGHMRVEKAEVASGIVHFTDAAQDFYREGATLPLGYPLGQWEKMQGVALAPEQTADIVPGPLTVNHPFCFLPQSLVMRIGIALDVSPLALMYAGRLAGLMAALALTFLAIRIMPSHRFGLCALALLPPITFSRSCVDSDPVTCGLAFLFIACTLRAVKAQGRIGGRALLGLAALAFVLAQCKNIYLMLPFLALAIPASRFASRGGRLAALALIILPGLAASIWWLVSLKHSLLAGITYHTWGGEVDPDRQTAFILHHPLAYLGIVLRTLFMTPFFVQAIIGVLGIFGPPVSLWPPVYVLLLLLVATVLALDVTAKLRYGRALAWLTAALFAAFLGLSLTALYIQWMGYGAPDIEGFQGRYLYPLLPLLLVFTRPLDAPARLHPAAAVGALAVIGLGAMFWTTTWAYYAVSAAPG